MFAKRLKTLANRLLAKRLVGERSVNRYKGSTYVISCSYKRPGFFRLATNRKAARVLSRIYRLVEEVPSGRRPRAS